jgi:hypothetical protein
LHRTEPGIDGHVCGVIDGPLQGRRLAGLDLCGLNGKSLNLGGIVADHQCNDAAYDA